MCVTFDDGYRDFLTTAFPVLKKYGIKTTVFLVTNLIGGTYTTSMGDSFEVLSEPDLTELSASGLVEFMPHSLTHPDLDRIPLEQAKREIEDSRSRVRQLTGKPADVFSFPRGRYTPVILEMLRASGWRAALTVVPGVARGSSDPMQLPRFPIDAATSMRAFRAGLAGKVVLYRVLKALRSRGIHV